MIYRPLHNTKLINCDYVTTFINQTRSLFPSIFSLIVQLGAIAMCFEFIFGDYFIVKYEGTYFPCEVLNVLNESANVKVLVPSRPQYWKWPD